MTWRSRRNYRGAGRPVVDGIPDPPPPRDGLRVAPGRAPELPIEQCTRCGAVGTHYLTCPGLRLPPGYRLNAEPAG